MPMMTKAAATLTERAGQLAPHQYGESFSEHVADFLLERGEVALVRVEISADHAAARHRRENDDTIEKPEPVEDAKATEVKRDGAGATSGQRQTNFWDDRFVHANPERAPLKPRWPGSL